MPAVAEIYSKAGEHTLILNTRCQLIYPFEAPNWTDLRVGFLLSLTQTTLDDDTTTLAENIPLVGDEVPPEDRYWIGLKTNNDLLPLNNGVNFIGFTNFSTGNHNQGTSSVVSSDAGIGTTNAYFWRPKNDFDNPACAYILEGVFDWPRFTDIQQHFAQVPASAGGYATLLMMRITRASGEGGNGNGKGPGGSPTPLTVSIKTGGFSADVLFTNTPTLDLLETNLAAYPAVVQTVTAALPAPDALYLYWPFHSSRLRCHALGFMKFR